MRTVFSSKHPILAFNELADQTDRDEQEGTMHLFEGAVLAIEIPAVIPFRKAPSNGRSSTFVF